MRAILLLLFSFVYTFSSTGQNLAIGQWRTHLPYQAGVYVTQSAEQVFYATGGAILTIDKDERSIGFLDKVNGLSSTGISLLKYHQPSQTLVVIYENSAIDLVDVDGRVTTLNQIPNFANIVGEKSIAQVHIDSDSTILLASSFGLSKLHILRKEFAWTTFTGVPTQDVTTHKGHIYLATEEGIYSLAEDNRSPEDFSAWNLLDQEEGFPAFYISSATASFGDLLYFDMDNTVFSYDGDTLLEVRTAPDGTSLAYLSTDGPHLLMGYACNTGCQGRVFYINQDGSQAQLERSCVGIPTSVIEDERGRLWFGDRFRMFRTLNNIEANDCEFLSFNSPFSTENREMAVYNNELWLATGGVTNTFNYRFLDHGLASFIDGQWSLFSRRNTRAFQGVNENSTDDDLFDIVSVAINPANGKVYAGSFFEGLLEIDGEEFTLYNDENSSLGNAVGDPLRTRIGGLAFDDGNNLWVTNHTAEFPLSVFTADGIWKKFRPSCNVGEIHQIAIDGSGFKWMVSNNSGVGVIVFDEGDFEAPGDDRCRIFTSGNSELPTNMTNCIVSDLDGDIWVGTSEGIIIFECGNSAFEDICRGTARVFDEGGFNEALLNTEDIQTIAVDGANRKWIGTKNGVFVLSSDGEEEIAHFTVNNSPLLNNSIIDIAVNNENGEVFIGTDEGIISYRSDAIAGGSTHKSNVKVYPNPVRPDYRGPIAIQGLSRDATVKITDINGRLVFETTANGGQAIWEGTDYTGRRVATGVYLVFSADNSRTAGFGQPSSAVARIVFIN